MQESSRGDSAARHTPGPWKVSDERCCETRHFATVICFAPKPDRGVEIARLRGGAPYRDGEGMANAQLIAASPDLLAAAKFLIYSSDTEGWDRVRGTDEPRTGMRELLAAIRKAEEGK